MCTINLNYFIFSQYDLFAELFKMQYNSLYFWAKKVADLPSHGHLPCFYLAGTEIDAEFEIVLIYILLCERHTFKDIFMVSLAKP